VGPFLDGALPSITPNSPGSSQWTTTPAFPNLPALDTIVIASNPAGGRLFVGAQDGQIVSFENQPDASTTQPFLDLRDRVALVFEGGLLGLAFHPEFDQAGSPHRNSFYVYYSSHCPLDGSKNAPDLNACDESYPRDNTAWGFFNVYLRLSRFEMFDGTSVADPSSEQVLLNFRLYRAIHRGGGLGVRDDGYLYLSIGDQSDPDSAQSISDNFNGSTLRIAVNVGDNGDGTWSCPPGTHVPRRIFGGEDETSGQYYCIPDDNPWLDPGGSILEEYCAIGLRNPFRLSVDSATGRVWVGDVGELSREEVDVIECGNNYGWPFREGTISGIHPEPASYLGQLTEPVVDFTRSEANSIIGGLVYRGSRFPELYGRYLVGDFGTNRIWAITLDETSMTGTKTYLTNFSAGNLVAWGQDSAGEVFFGNIYSTGLIYELERVTSPPPDAPALLSATGAFADMATATSSAFWVPYGLNQPFWSDGASKFRYIALPNDGVRDNSAERVGFSEMGDWTYPTGTVLMKHFELPLDETDPSVTTRLETRLIVLGEDDVWYGLTYRWRLNQLEADLLTMEETADYTIQLAAGGTRTQTWYFPSRLDCLRCHRQGSGGALGLKTHQLNGDITYPSTGRTDNQLVSWSDLGMLSPPVSASEVTSMLRSPAYVDVTAPLEDRARSWLDSNCSYCHRAGEVDAGFDARFTVPFADQGFLWTPVRNDLGNPGTVVVYPGDPVLSALWQRSAAVGPIAMPPLAKALPEQPAVDLLEEWIERLPSSSPNDVPVLVDPGDQSSQPGEVVALALDANDPDGDVLFYDAVGLPEGLSVDPDTGVISGTAGGSSSHVVTASASDGPSVSVVSFAWSVTSGSCGDGTQDDGEGCDDGNTADGDGCTSSCVVEVCGDGVVNNAGAEDCEPPNTSVCTSTCTTRTPLCGDGFLTPPEACDDGNTVSGDGCTSSCVVEVCGDGIVNNGGAEECEPPATALCTDGCTTRAPSCGDGYQTPPEQCEDGNVVDGDGCTSSCVLELCGDGVVNNAGAEDCEPPGTAVCTDGCTTRLPVCGDGYQTPPEQCEDGNVLDGDGCTSSCVLELCGDGVVNNAGAEDCEPPGTALCTDSCTTRLPVCGDGFLTPPEACDDGNLSNGDGCSVACEIEVPPACGDGNVDSGEQCDDGNLTSGDGCTAGCAIESCGDGVINNGGTEDCEPPGTATCTASCQLRVPLCGDGFQTPPEQCEDGNVLDGDGCTSSCVLELCGDGVVNNGGAEDCEPPGTATCTSGCTTRVPLCGDGLLTPPEACDDGNTADGDGCTSDCVVEVCGDGVVNNGAFETCEPPGTATCSESCTSREPSCGDGYVTAPEECDDGNLTSGDGCSDGCAFEYCGDGLINDSGAEDCEPPGTALCTDDCRTRDPLCGDGHRTPPEQCEDGNTLDGDGCTASCILELCGDGLVTPPEACDDGNLLDQDGCSSVCEVEIPAFCGDGELDVDEECDDGNLADGDGCSSACELEPIDPPDGGTPMPDGGVPMPDAGAPDEPDASLPDPPPLSPRGGTVSGGCSVSSHESPLDLSALWILCSLALLRRRWSSSGDQRRERRLQLKGPDVAVHHRPIESEIKTLRQERQALTARLETFVRGEGGE
jgi:uncharacterized repeat protein (TIGR03806 family)